MPEMTPCSSCDRYVKGNASACPFCGAPCTASPSPAHRPAPGLSRAAAFSVRAVLATGAIAAAVACGDDDEDKNKQAASGGQASGGEASGGEASGGEASGGVASGGVANGGSLNTGGTSDGGLGGFTPIPVYGGPFPDMVRAKV